MVGILVSLDQNFQVTRQTKSGESDSEKRVEQTRTLKARFLVTPNGKVDAQKLGVVTMTLEAEPSANFPDLNHAELERWLCEVLKGML